VSGVQVIAGSPLVKRMSEEATRDGHTASDQVFIRETPGVSGGYPCVGNTRIPVRSIVLAHRQTGSFERTLDAYPQLTRAEVRAALDYYAAHPARVDEDIQRNESVWEEITRRP